MTIFYMELKKIWNLPTVLLLLVLMFLNFTTKNQWSESLTTNNGSNGDEWSVMVELTETFGTTLEEDEFPLAQEMLTNLHRELDEIIQNHPDFPTNEVKDFATFKYNEERSYSIPAPENGEALGTYMYQYYSHLLYKEQNFSNILNSYEAKRENPAGDTYSSAQSELALSQWNQGKGRSLVPYHLEYITQGCFVEHFFDTFLYILLLLLPTVVRDRKNNVRELQWSSTTGRKILTWQFMAHWVTALIFLLPCPIFFLYYFNVENIRYFWDHSMLFFHYGFGYLLDFTYIQLLCCYFLFSFVFGLVLAGIIFLLSNQSKNYPTLLLKAIPLTYLIYATTDSWLRLFSLNHRPLLQIILPWSAWLEVYLLLLAVIFLGVMTLITFRKEKYKDL